MKEFTVYLSGFIVLALAGGFGDTPHETLNSPETQTLAILLNVQ